jgi:hypothetical protein
MNNTSETITIPLTKGYSAIIDAVDYPHIQQYNWIAQIYYEEGRREDSSVYAVTVVRNEGKQKGLRMHRLIVANAGLNIDGYQVDHINRNGLDNRRCNLRLATAKENQRNSRPSIDCTSQFKGVWTNKQKAGGFISQIRLSETERISIGYFDNEIDAAKAYDAYALAYHGEFAYLNFPDEPVWTIAEADARKRVIVPKSGYRGVYLADRRKPNGYWMATIKHKNERIVIGNRFETPLEAALAYDEAAIRLKGDKAKLNITQKYSP